MFDYEHWNRKADELAREYRGAAPFPNIAVDDFLDPEVARALNREFDQVDWMSYRHYNENKQGGNVAKLPPRTSEVLRELNSPRFLDFLTRLTGIENLIPDHELGSGGIHQSTRGGFLNIHADFTAHPYHHDWHRRLNVLVYVTEGWQEDWGAQLELWRTDMSKCERRIMPKFNRCVVFNTAEDSFHGHPEPTTCPEGVFRRSIALYYYTLDENVKLIATEYRSRPQDSGIKSAFIFFDKLALAAFHKIKATFHISDHVVTSVMSVFKKKR